MPPSDGRFPGTIPRQHRLVPRDAATGGEIRFAGAPIAVRLLRVTAGSGEGGPCFLGVHDESEKNVTFLQKTPCGFRRGSVNSPSPTRQRCFGGASDGPAVTTKATRRKQQQRDLRRGAPTRLGRTQSILSLSLFEIAGN